MNFIVGWNVFAKLTELETSCIEMFHSENMSSINYFQNKGLEGLAISSRFPRSAITITEKATAVLVPMVTPCVCMKSLSLNLKEFSSSMSRKSSRKSLVGIGKLCS